MFLLTLNTALIAILLLFGQESLAQDDDNVGFKDLAPPSLFVGSVFHGNSPTWRESDYRTLALKNFNIMTSSIYLTSVWKGPSQPIDVSAFAEVVNFLNDRDVLVHGHALLYPAIATKIEWWNNQPVADVEQNMFKYMNAVAQAGKGKVYSWDVVNEVMGDNNNDMDSDGVRRFIYNGPPIKEYEAMGQDYIRKAFRFAREADPTAKLMLTDYGCEEDFVDDDNEKSDRLYRFVSKLLSEGIPIDGIGFQMHVGSDVGTPTYYAIARNFERFRKLGLLIYITEMDVSSYSTKDRDNAPQPELVYASRSQSQVYRRILEVCMEEPACQSFRFWDFAEYNSRVPTLRYSWLHPITYDENKFGVYTFPTPFWDINPNNFRAKLAWYEMRDAMIRFNENEGGIYRIASDWRKSSSYLGRAGISNNQGGYNPGPEVELFQLNEEWSSLKWKLERVAGTSDVYRIRCMWAQGYLSREGVQNAAGTWIPQAKVYLDNLQTSWTSQQWVLGRRGTAYTIRCLWGNGNDYMTRVGIQDASGSYQPTNTVRLQSDANYSSQRWFLDGTE